MATEEEVQEAERNAREAAAQERERQLRGGGGDGGGGEEEDNCAPFQSIIESAITNGSDLVNPTMQCQKLKVRGRELGEGDTDPDAINDGPRGPKER